jgi:hypothetical protein
MEVFIYFTLIISLLAPFGCILAVRLTFLLPGTDKLPQVGNSVFVINCTLSTYALMQQLQNLKRTVAGTAAGLGCLVNPNLPKSLPAAVASGNTMITTHTSGLLIYIPKKETPQSLFAKL